MSNEEKKAVAVQNEDDDLDGLDGAYDSLPLLIEAKEIQKKLEFRIAQPP